MQLLAAWHSHTSYVLFHDGNYHTVQTGRGVRQGCRVAPVLWATFMNLMFSRAAEHITPEWVQRTLTLFADDLHHGTVFYDEVQLRTALRNIGTLMDILEDLGLEISYEKTFILIKISGTNARRVRAQYLHSSLNGYVVHIPRRNGTITVLPVKNSAAYLGIQASYDHFEMQSLQKRIKCAKIAFHRLRKWLCSRRIALNYRLQLWRTCIFTSICYGLHAVGWTLQGLQIINTVLIQMLRTICRDHSYLTGHTHHRFLQLHCLDVPLRLILQSAVQLRGNHQQRCMQLQSNDILWTINWSSHLQTIQLIHTAIDLFDQAPLMSTPSHAAEPSAEAHYICQWCQLSCGSLPNLRRHQTTVHGYTQFRTSFCTAASHALHGLPQCATCHMSFTTWRSFQIHLERRCCEALSTSSRMTPPMAAGGLTAAHLERLHRQPEGLSFLSAVSRKAWEDLLQFPAILQELKRACVICGIFHHRPQELNQHLRLHHPELIPHVFTKTVQLCRAHATISPCRFCDREFAKSHMCPVLTQAALLCVNLPQDIHRPGDHAAAVLHCEICHQSFEDVGELHAHLKSIHNLELQDWLPSRDLLGNDPVCAHCRACFTSKAAVRHHICQGHCREFDPHRLPYQMAVPIQWEHLLLTGNLATLHSDSMARLRLTVKCQLCLASFDRQMDLSLHLQTVHAMEWMQSQPLVQLHLKVNYAQYGCLCNPSTHGRGLSHICPAYRQLSMLAMRLHVDLLLPWPISSAEASTALKMLRDHPAYPLLLQSLQDRQFPHLWQDDSCCNALSSTCCQCGGTFAPTELREHLARVHPLVMPAVDSLMPLLLSCYINHLNDDFQCEACGMIFNLPATARLDPPALQQRHALAQQHCRYQCPVFAQTAILLSHERLRSEDAGPQRGYPTSRDFQAHARPSTQPPGSKRRRRTTKQENQALTVQFGHSVQPGTTPASHARTTGDQAGYGQPGHAQTRLFRLLHANAERSNPSNTVDDSEGLAQQSCHQDGGGTTEIRVSSSSLGADADHGPTSSHSTTEDRSEQTGRPSMEDGNPTWDDRCSWQLALQTLECTETKPAGHNADAHSDGQNAQVCDSAAGSDHRAHSSDEI